MKLLVLLLVALPVLAQAPTPKRPDVTLTADEQDTILKMVEAMETRINHLERRLSNCLSRNAI